MGAVYRRAIGVHKSECVHVVRERHKLRLTYRPLKVRVITPSDLLAISPSCEISEGPPAHTQCLPPHTQGYVVIGVIFKHQNLYIVWLGLCVMHEHDNH